MKAKKVIEGILTLTAASAIILCTAETEDANLQVIWTLSCICVTAICAKILDKMGTFKEVRK